MGIPTFYMALGAFVNRLQHIAIGHRCILFGHGCVTKRARGNEFGLGALLCGFTAILSGHCGLQFG